MQYFLNGWNFVHLFGAYFIATFIAAIWNNANPIFVLILTLVFDILKETGDTVSKIYKIKWMWTVGFDPAGFDLRDVLMALIGILLAGIQISMS
jgi:hypothetical protein